MNKRGTIIKVDVSKRGNNHSACFRASNNLRAIVGKSVAGIDNIKHELIPSLRF
jgi:hypothetical protein